MEPPDDAELIAETVAVFEEDSWIAFDPDHPYPDGAAWHKELVERVGPEKTSAIWRAAIDAHWGPPEQRRRRLDKALGR